MKRNIKQIVESLEIGDTNVEVELVEALESVSGSEAFIKLDIETISKTLKKESGIGIFSSDFLGDVGDVVTSGRDQVLGAFQHAMRLVSDDGKIEIRKQVKNAKTIVSIIRGTKNLGLSVVEEAISLLKSETNAKDIFIGADCSMEKGVRVVLITASSESE
ncbi:MAG: hypothetical protein FWC11_01985 [Firmicutes bacterium]|nr:hypothetical protein [Bacillota bacterium]